MCSVVGCDSWRRSALRFKLPEDPERRMEWVQFLLKVNGQRLKESSWTDITICREHFTDDCFASLTHPPGTVLLMSSAVPSVWVKSEPEDPVEGHVGILETTDVTIKQESLHKCSSPTFDSDKIAKASPESSGVSQSPPPPDVSHSVASGSEQTKKNVMTEFNVETASHLQIKGKHLVNERCLLQLFRRKCPSCGSKLQMEKVVYGVLTVLNQQCLQCDYSYQWKSQINAIVPTAEGQCLKGGTGVTPENKPETPTEENPSSTVFSEIVTFSDEERDPSDEGGEGDDDEDKVSSDLEWTPTVEFYLAEELAKESEEESEEEEEEEELPGSLKINELCTDCGCFFNILKPHTCEYKIKPFSCNICGKRCTTELSLKLHSKIHDETYELPCGFCHVTFKTKADKSKHEQTHKDNKDPYKCPDCPETFPTNKKRNIHLANHRTSKEFKCGVCGIVFKDIHHLRRHSVVHTGLKPYKCSVCQRAFSQASHLKSHIRLHTGERPFKCKHCARRFNHNVSLKSHVQRYHSSGSGQKKDNKSDTGGNKEGTDSEFDDAQEETDTKEEPVKVRSTKRFKRSSGRPRGRPKRNDESSPGGKNKSRRSSSKRISCNEEESEEEQSYSDLSFDSEEEEEDEPAKSTARSRGGSESDSYSDFDPEGEIKKKRSRGKSAGKCGSRPKKNPAV